MMIPSNKTISGDIATIDVKCPNCDLPIRVEKSVFEKNELFRCMSCGQPLKKSIES